MLSVLGVWCVAGALWALELQNQVQVETTPTPVGNPPVGGEKAFADGKLYYNAMPSTPAQGTAVKVIDSTDDKDYLIKTFKLANTGIVYEIRDFLYGPLELEGAKVTTSKDTVTEEEYLVITAPEFMFPWVEATIKALDKPGTSYEYSGSQRLWYTCVNRKASELREAIEKTLGTKFGDLVIDDTINHIMYKDAPTIAARVAKWLPYFDIAPEMVRIEAQIVEVNVGDDFNFGLALEAWKEGLPENVDIKMDLQDTRDSSRSSEIYQDLTTPYKITQKPFNSHKQYLAGSLTASGMRPKAMANFINYMVRTGNAKVLCTPTVVALNGRQATITSIDKVDYKAYTAPSQPLQKQVGSGITLTITPTIAAESMQLQINAVVDSLVGYASSGEPVLNSRATTAQVVLQDGELFTLSGLRKEVVTKQDERVPVLGSTPFFGYLFRHEIDVTKASEIVVLLTPYKVTASTGILERERKLLEDVQAAQNAPARSGWEKFKDRVIKNKNVAEQDPNINF
jgi:type II secretory pathway component GspD/PulD (secretin)